MTTEIIDKLFLELSQVTTAKTKKELALEMKIEQASQRLNTLRNDVLADKELAQFLRGAIATRLWSIHDGLHHK